MRPASRFAPLCFPAALPLTAVPPRAQAFQKGPWLFRLFLLGAVTFLLGCTTRYVYQAPAIVSFSATPSVVPAGQGSSLTAVFTGGEGRVSGLGTAVSGTPLSTGSLSANTTFTLTVTGPGGTASRDLLVQAVPAPDTLVISASATFNGGDSGTASVPAQDGVTYDWTIAGGGFVGPATGASVAFNVYTKPTLHLTCTATNGLGVRSATASHDSTVTFSTTDVLKALNVPTNLGPRLGARGQALSEADHPLGATQANILRIQEILTFNEHNQFGIAHPEIDYSSITALSLPSNASSLAAYKVKNVVKARLAGDGTEQVVIAAFGGPGGNNLTFDLWLLSGGATRTLTRMAIVPWPGLRTMILNPEFPELLERDWHQKISMVAGDIDGDGKDEIVLAADGQLFLFDHDLHLISLSDFGSLAIDPINSQPINQVECCDLDHDGRAEIILMRGGLTTYTTAQMVIIKYMEDGTLSYPVESFPIARATHNLRCASVKAADLDGDGVPEIVFAGVPDKYDPVVVTEIVHITVGSDGTWTPVFLPFDYADDMNSMRWGGCAGPDFTHEDACVPILALADLDGDGVMEIMSNDAILEYTAATSTAVPTLKPFRSNTDNFLRADEVWCWSICPNPNPRPEDPPGWNWALRRKDTAQFNQIAVGKVTGDPTANNQIFIMDQNGEFLRHYYYDSGKGAMARGPDIPLNTSGSYSCLCLADLDQDGTYVQYLGHTLAFTPPVITTVLASPPYWADLASPQNIGNSVTQWGRSLGSSSGAGAHVGFSVGATVGAKGSIPILSNGEVEIRVTERATLDFAFDQESGYQREVAYATYAGTDAVLFATVPIDIYLYQVTAAGPTAPVKAGDRLTIPKARSPLLQFTDVQFYNDRCGGGLPIDSRVLPQTMGQPRTYPTKDQAMALVLADPQQAFLLSNAQAGIVPEGNLYNTISYSTSLTLGTSFSFEYEHTVEVEASFGIIAGASYSLHAGFNLFTKIEMGESLVGSVGGLPLAEYVPDRLFNWGIFSYTATLPMAEDSSRSQSFKVVNYWVQ